MGDLAVRVLLGDYVVNDRLLRFRGITTIGDCMDSHVAFPGATIPIVRVGNRYRLRGRNLDEGEELRISLGTVDVWVRNVPGFRGPAGSSSFIDRRFVVVAALLVAVGSWVDAAEAWVDEQPQATSAQGGAKLKMLMERVRNPAQQRQTATVRASRYAGTKVQHVQRIADGPRHLPDDTASGTAFYGWYRAAVPADPLAQGANERLGQDSTDGAARRILANAAYNADRYEVAAWHYQVLSWEDHADAIAMIGLAQAQRRRGHHASEIQVYRRILETWMDHAGALSGLATALARMGRLDEAEGTLEQLRVVAPDDPYTDVAGATVAALEGRDEDALDFLDRALGARAQLAPSLQIELRRDLSLDPAFASLRKDRRLKALLRRHLGAAAPRSLR